MHPRRTLCLVVLACVLSGRGLAAQARPDFSGTWVFDPERSTRTQDRSLFQYPSTTPTIIPVPLVPVLGSEFVASQDGRALTVHRTIVQMSGPQQVLNGVRVDMNQVGPPVAYDLVYPLDGSETRNKIPQQIATAPVQETISTATWAEKALVVRTRPAAVPAAGVQERVWHVEADGSLVIQVKTTAPNQPETNTTHVYRRKREPVATASVPAAAANFSGRWVFDREHSSKAQVTKLLSPPNMWRNVLIIPVFGDELIITQDPRSLALQGTMNRTPQPGGRGEGAPPVPVEFRMNYALDGSDTRTMQPGVHSDQPDMEIWSTLAWDGKALVITTRWPAGQDANYQKRVLHLEPDGSLVIEVMTPWAAHAAETTTYVYRLR